jgi:indole-3-glycerol phosphate synthase
VHSLLKQIIDHKRHEVARLKREGLPPAGEKVSRCDFRKAVSIPGRTSVIAEIKFASPSAGTIRERSDPRSIGRLYEKIGAGAVSLITDEKFFRGNPKHLPLLKHSICLPLLRKDFIIDEAQIVESACLGADAVLLIARLLSAGQLRDFLALCREVQLDALTEVHDRADLEQAVGCGAGIIGINNRDLDTFEVNLATTAELAPLVAATHVVVSESGVKSGEDIRYLRGFGVHAVLVGTSLMGSEDVAGKLRELVEAGRTRINEEARTACNGVPEWRRSR